MRKRKFTNADIQNILHGISHADLVDFYSIIKLEEEKLKSEDDLTLKDAKVTIKDLILEKGVWGDEEEECFHTDNISMWPHVKETASGWVICDSEDSESDGLDLENCDYKILNDDFAVVSCGGDWQDPFTVILKRDGHAVNVVGVINNDKIIKSLANLNLN